LCSVALKFQANFFNCLLTQLFSNSLIPMNWSIDTSLVPIVIDVAEGDAVTLLQMAGPC
jgi:hypothetical protein